MPYNDREIAKKHGAKWDAIKKKWYLPAGVEMHANLEKYNPNNAATSAPKPAYSGSVQRPALAGKSLSEMNQQEVGAHISDLKKRSVAYNKVMNEGGEGFNPFDDKIQGAVRRMQELNGTAAFLDKQRADEKNRRDKELKDRLQRSGGWFDHACDADDIRNYPLSCRINALRSKLIRK